MKNLMLAFLLITSFLGIFMMLQIKADQPKQTEKPQPTKTVNSTPGQMISYDYPVIEVTLTEEINLHDYLKSENINAYSPEEIMEYLRYLNYPDLNLDKGAKLSLIDFNEDNQVNNSQGRLVNTIAMEMPSE